MANYTFDADEQDFTAGDCSWSNTDGSPAAGCMLKTGTASFQTATTQTGTVSIAVTAGQPISFRYRVQGTPNGDMWGPYLTCSTASDSEELNFVLDTIPESGDTGWVLKSGVFSFSGTVITITAVATFSNPDAPNIFTSVAFDSIYVGESPGGLPQTRYLGMAADNSYLYVTSIQGGSLTLEYSSLGALGIVAGSATFGTAAYTDPDTYTRALYPVSVGDLELYLYGRDGNNRQVQYNDLNGTLGWVEGGPGTATWATGKFCVALMPQAYFPYSVIAAFADDDIYLTVDGSAAWVKQGDAGTVLRTAGRVTTEFSSILVAGQGTAQMYFSQNYGVSFTNAFSGLAGTVNAIEVSR